MRYFIFLITLVFTLNYATMGYAADSAEERYQKIKEETMNTGAAGFDTRHKAYSRYVMDRRKSDINKFADIAPAAGDMEEEKIEQPAKIPTYND